MAPGAPKVMDVVKKFISLCSDDSGWETRIQQEKYTKFEDSAPDGELSAAFSKNLDDFSKIDATVGNCNALVYESVKRRLKSRGKITDFMSDAEIDWIIFTDKVIQRSILQSLNAYYSMSRWDRWGDIVYVKLHQFPRFSDFNIQNNKRCLLAWMELITKIKDTETKKLKSKGGKKTVAYESSKVIEKCQDLMEMFDEFNFEVNFV